MDEKQKSFMVFLEQKAAEQENFVVDFDQILNVLDANLPMIPGRPEVVQVNPPPYKDPIRITFGKLMPKEKKDKDDKKGKAKAKAVKRGKDEKPPKAI